MDTGKVTSLALPDLRAAFEVDHLAPLSGTLVWCLVYSFTLFPVLTVQLQNLHCTTAETEYKLKT